ncbi:hypothetical protein DPMN_158878 [Dreissena polymorpha]|uniref:Uncharacterized protein n=1 Tax=Dreissena polymorpha TaxID=45954 RepID=A0A9D4IR97_DREPO|nr:hypothetical protein DPMN_158878 [Dreissena polymorpha]
MASIMSILPSIHIPKKCDGRTDGQRQNHKSPPVKPGTKNAPPTGAHVFKATRTIFDLVQDTIGTNLLTKFHDDRKINVASRVFTRKNASPPWRPCFQPTGIIFEHVQDNIGMKLLVKFHEDQTINMASREKCPAHWQPFFQANIIIFERMQDIIETKFHEDRTIYVASRVLTIRQMLTPHDG